MYKKLHSFLFIFSLLNGFIKIEKALVRISVSELSGEISVELSDELWGTIVLLDESYVENTGINIAGNSTQRLTR